MDFESAKGIGDEGERLVAEELERLAPIFHFKLVNDILLKAGDKTTQIDHLTVDRHGVVVFESKVRGALVLGNDVEKKWTACYPSGAKKPFQNPLAQNRHHQEVLRRALKDERVELPPDYYKDAVVFVDSNVSKLELDALSRAKVVQLDGLATYFEFRRDFAFNEGALTAEDIDNLVRIVMSLDKSDDPVIVAKHAASHPGSRRKSHGPFVPPSRKVGSTQLPREARKQLVTGYGTDSVMTILRSTPAKRPMPRWLRKLIVDAVALAVVAALAWWFFLGGGVFVLSAWLTRTMTSNLPKPPVAQPLAAPTPASARVPLAVAKQKLAQSFPKEYPRVADLDTPVVEAVGSKTKFTWHYLTAVGNRAQTHSVSLTLANDGTVWGAGKD